MKEMAQALSNNYLGYHELEGIHAFSIQDNDMKQKIIRSYIVEGIEIKNKYYKMYLHSVVGARLEFKEWGQTLK